jgi:hypothetical protein
VDWLEARARLADAMFEPLAPVLARLPAERWPTHEELTALAAGLTTSRGQPLRFVPARAVGDDERRRYYELHIADTGEIETRAQSWHDTFNALVWITFPRAKAAINAQHVALLQERGEAEARKRGPERDALTLFDEGGVAIASADAGLDQLVRDFLWKDLFWERRAQVLRSMRFFVFGHGCYEQALAPYIGMVAKTAFVRVEAGFFELSLEGQLRELDAGLARHFADRANVPSPRAMAPMPVLGVPGWHPGSFHEVFYDDASHFRSKGLRTRR